MWQIWGLLLAYLKEITRHYLQSSLKSLMHNQRLVSYDLDHQDRDLNGIASVLAVWICTPDRLNQMWRTCYPRNFLMSFASKWRSLGAKRQVFFNLETKVKVKLFSLKINKKILIKRIEFKMIGKRLILLILFYQS